MRSFTLGACAAMVGVVARAAPQKGIVPIFRTDNATKPTPAPGDASCSAQCEVRYPELSALSWVPEYRIVYTTEITIGTVSILTTTSGNTTLGSSTHTNYNGDLPSEYNLFRQTTDADTGTLIVPVAYSLSNAYSWTTYTYPTPWLDYPSNYHWQGVLPTNKETVQVCATATELENADLVKHPEYSQPTNVVVDRNDLVGTGYKPLWVPVQDMPDKSWFDSAFPLESAFSYCASVHGKPAPTQFDAPKFVLDTVTLMTSKWTGGIIVIQTPETGFEETSSIARKPTPTPIITAKSSSAIAVILNPVPGFDDTSTARTTNGAGPQTTLVPGPVNDFKPKPPPSGVPNRSTAQPGVMPAPAQPQPTPTFTIVLTVVNGKPTAIPAFVVPGFSAIATIGQTITLNGRSTVLAAPPAAFAMIPTTTNNVATFAPAFIISGTSTASVGQTVTLNGQPSVLAAPAAVVTVVPTTIDGVATSVSAYIISGSSTAFPGQIVTINNQPTVLPALGPVPTSMTITINGVSTVISAYIISGSITATPGQTVAIDGQPTVLPALGPMQTKITTTVDGVETILPAYVIDGSITATVGQTVMINGETSVLHTPTGTDGVGAGFGGPATTYGSGPAGTTNQKPNGASRTVSVSWNVVVIMISVMFDM